MRFVLATPRQQQSRAEEIANSISHGIGLAGALVGAPFLVMRAVRLGDVGFLVGVCVFSATILLLYLASTLYHALPLGRAKHVFRVIEHSTIFLLIAGTYTPFMLGVLRGAWGWSLLGIVWGIALIGVVLKITGNLSGSILSTALYLVMGWILVIAVEPLLARMPRAGFLWLIAGGLSYTAGVAFFATDHRLRYGHLIWHLFVMAGTACHYFAVLWYGA